MTQNSPKKESALSLVWEAAKSPLKTFIESKKFKALIVGILSIVATWIAGLVATKFGVELKPEDLTQGVETVAQYITTLTAAYLGSQAVSDATKEKAKAAAEKPNTEAPSV